MSKFNQPLQPSAMKMKLSLGSVCFAQNGDRILLLQRNHPPFQGKWDGLQGRIEFGESPAQAAAREVYEESGLTLQRKRDFPHHTKQGIVKRPPHPREALVKRLSCILAIIPEQIPITSGK